MRVVAFLLLGAAAGMQAKTSMADPPMPRTTTVRPAVIPVFTDLGSRALELRRRIAALHRLDAARPSSPLLRRNPLRSSQVHPSEMRGSLDVENVAASQPPAAAVATAPVLVLVGIAEERAGGAVVRTAVITGTGNDVHLAGEGDALAGFYTVRAIEEEAVLLDDVNGGGVRRLTMAGFTPAVPDGVQ